jgi:hypothetical protein
MDQPDIMCMLKSKFIDEVKNTQRIISIVDPDTRKHQESILLWKILPDDIKTKINIQFKKWIGDCRDDEKSDDPGDSSDSSDSSDSLESYHLPIVYMPGHKKQKRIATTPIHMSSCNILMRKKVNISKNMALCAIYRTAFRTAILDNSFDIIWDMCKPGRFLSKTRMSSHCALLMFNYVHQKDIIHFKDALISAALIVHNVLLDSGIYDKYPAFNDYKNIAINVVLHGVKYCKRIINNPHMIQPLLQYQDYHEVCKVLYELY